MKVELVEWQNSWEEDTTYQGVLVSGRIRRTLFSESSGQVLVIEDPKLEFSHRRKEIKVPVRTVQALMQLAILQARLAPWIKKVMVGG